MRFLLDRHGELFAQALGSSVKTALPHCQRPVPSAYDGVHKKVDIQTRASSPAKERSCASPVKNVIDLPVRPPRPGNQGQSAQRGQVR